MRFALAGNPNCGKTTLFNTLTGSTAHVGNWPGVTVDRKEGSYKELKENITIIDLPGIYSLSPYSPEEIVARNYIIDEKPEVVINIIDATNLERNLYLTTQLLETDASIVVALNMMDILEKNGDKIDVAYLEKQLGVPVVPISALHDDNIKDLMKRAVDVSKVRRVGNSVIMNSNMEQPIKKIEYILRANNLVESIAFHAVKLLEADEFEVTHIPEAISKEIDEVRQSVVLDKVFDRDFEAAIADARYKYIEANYSKALKRAEKKSDSTTSDKIDNLLTHKWLGIPIFLFFMFVVFHLTFGSNFLFFTGLETPGVLLQSLVGNLMGFITDIVSSALESSGANPVIYGAIVDGLLAGIDGVLSFIPQIMLLFLFLSIMEDSGYMARAAFLMDRLLRRFGLSGKAFLPMLMGFGCSVPAIMATRSLEAEKDRRMTIMLIVGFSCGAKLPIWSLFSMALFPDHADLVVFSIYLLGIVVAMIAGLILKSTVFKGDSVPFVMELPAYHMPRLKNLIIHLWQKLKGYVVRAGTIIAASAIIIWFLSNFNLRLQMVSLDSADSILGVIGTVLIPIFKPLGFVHDINGWKAIVAILTGLIAKEMIVSTLGVLYNPGVEGDALEDSHALEALFPALVAAFTPASAFSFMAFSLLCVPCMAAVAATRSELRSGKWLFRTILFWMVLAYVTSFIIYQVGTLLGF